VGSGVEPQLKSNLVHFSIFPAIHISEVIGKAHQTANANLRCFVSRNNTVLIQAFLTYVRPLLEYNCVIWLPTLKQDIAAIEKVQKRFTKKLVDLKSPSYQQLNN